MSYGVPTHGNGYKVDPQLTAQVKAQLLANPQFAAWARSVGDAVAAPQKFGITGLPSGAWIDKQGNVQTSPGFVSYALSPKVAWPLYAAATAGTIGALSGGGGATSSAMTTQQMYDAGLFAGPSNMAAANAAGTLGGAAGAADAGTSIAKRVTDFFTKHGGIKDAASLAALLPLLRSGGGSGGSGGTNTPFADLQGSTDVQDAYALQKRRTLATQPAFDALVNQAYGMTPTRYRGAAPEGTPAAATEPVSGPYVYRGPQFG